MSRRRGRRVETMARDARVLEMYRAGVTPRQIAEKMGVTEGTVRTGIKRACTDYFRMEAEDQRVVEEDRLKYVIRQLGVLVNEPSYIVAPNGKVAVHPMTGEPLVDNSEKRQNLMALVKASESLRKLMGTDVPTRQKVEHTTELDAEIERLMEQLRGDGLARPSRGVQEGADSEAPGGTVRAGEERPSEVAQPRSAEAASSD